MSELDECHQRLQQLQAEVEFHRIDAAQKQEALDEALTMIYVLGRQVEHLSKGLAEPSDEEE